MNKFMKKIGVLCLGVITALGVGVAGSKARQAEAATTYTATMKKAVSTSGGTYSMPDGAAFVVGTGITNVAVTNDGQASLVYTYHRNTTSTYTIFNNGSSQIRLYSTATINSYGGEIKATIGSQFIITGYTLNYGTSGSGQFWTDGNASKTLAQGAASATAVSGLEMNEIRFVVKSSTSATGQLQITSLAITYESSVVLTNDDIANAFIAKVVALEGKITSTSATAITALESEYAGLAEEVKTLVDGMDYAIKIADLRSELADAIAVANQQVAATFIGEVDALSGKVTATSGTAITVLETKYNGLSPAVKILVDALDYATKIAALRLELADAIAVVNQQAAATFIGEVDALSGKVTATSGTAITALETKYNGLSAAVKILVDALEYATKIAALRSELADAIAVVNQQAVIDKIAALPMPSEISAADYLTVSASAKIANDAYKALPLDQQGNVTNSQKLIDVLDKLESVKPDNFEAANGLFVSGSSLPSGWLGSSTAAFNSSRIGINSNTGYIQIADLKLPENVLKLDIKVYSVTNHATNQATMTVFGLNSSGATMAENSQTFTPYTATTSNAAAVDTACTEENSRTVEISGIGVKGIRLTRTASSSNVIVRQIIVTAYLKEPVRSVGSVAINPNTLQLEVGETKNVSVSISPLNATDQTYTLISLDETVVSVTPAGFVTAVGAGVTKLRATTTDGGKVAECDVVVLIPPDLRATITNEFPAVSEFDTALSGLAFHVTTGTVLYRSYSSTKGAQMGSGSQSGEIRFSTSIAKFAANDFDKITINACKSTASSNTPVTLKVLVAGTQIGDEVMLTSVPADYTFAGIAQAVGKRATGLDVGSLEIVATTTSSGFFLKNVSIFGGAEQIQLSQSAALVEFITKLKSLDTCNDWNQAESVRAMYVALNDEEKALADIQTYMADGNIEANLMDKLAYMEELDLNGGSVSQSSSPLLIIGNENAMTLIAIIAVIGLSAIGAYYFLNKKKYAA